MTIGPKSHILVIGAGEFGAATALSLLQSGRYTVTILERAPTLPPEDAASTDLNKVVRFDYSDTDYAELAWHAIEEWRRPEWEGIYHEYVALFSMSDSIDRPHRSGVVLLGGEEASPYSQFARNAMNNVSRHVTVEPLQDSAGFRNRLDPSASGVAAEQNNKWGYFNPAGGWAHASAALTKLHEGVRALGGDIRTGISMRDLILGPSGDVRGVRSTEAEEYFADKVIVAAGSWSGKLLEGLLPDGIITATGQVIAAVQLKDEEEIKRYSKVPVIMNKNGTGFYSFPVSLHAKA